MVLLPLAKDIMVFGNTLILAVFPELYAIVALAATFLMGSALAA